MFGTFSATWNIRSHIVYQIYVYDVCNVTLTSPSSCGSSPPEPEPSSAALQWCQVCGGAYTAHGCPCKEPECACWCAVSERRIQSPKMATLEIFIQSNTKTIEDLSIVNKLSVIKGEHTGAFLSIGLMTNFLSLKEMFLISLHGNPILGVILLKKRQNQKLWVGITLDR